jgi:hypothetical protein
VVSLGFQSKCLAVRSPAFSVGVTANEAGTQVQVTHWPGRQEVDCQHFHWSSGQHDIYGSFLQAHQTMDGYSIVIYTQAERITVLPSFINRSVGWQT